MALQNQSAITAFLAGKGLPAAGIAGVEGNLQTESSGVPTAYNPGENAHGIVQWEGGRWSGPNGLQSFAAHTGGSATDLDTQLNFMWSELTSPGYSSTLSALMNATDPTEAARVFDTQYERSSAASLPAREANARALFAGGITGGSGGSAGAGGSSTGGPTASPAGFDWNPLNWPKDFLSMIGHYVVDAFLIAAGVVIVVVALVMLAKTGDGDAHDAGSPPPPATGGGGEPAPRRHPVVDDAGDAGEDAAVAA